jgi:undecaprenyl pyrophosphate synthase
MPASIEPFIRRFESLYREKFGNPPLYNATKLRVIVRRTLHWCDEGKIDAMELLSFLFDNWPRLSREMGFVGTPSLSILGSALCFQRLRDFMRDGFSTGVKDRFTPSSDKEAGW